jgi:hypothetical protein
MTLSAYSPTSSCFVGSGCELPDAGNVPADRVGDDIADDQPVWWFGVVADIEAVVQIVEFDLRSKEVRVIWARVVSPTAPIRIEE